MDWVLAGVGVAAVLAVAGSVVVIVGHPRSHPERVTEPESERALAAVGAPAPPIPVPASAPPPALPDPDVSRRAFLRRAAAGRDHHPGVHPRGEIVGRAVVG